MNIKNRNFIFTEKIKKREDFFMSSFLDQNIDEAKKISVIVVSHLIDTGIPYLNTLNKYFDLRAIIPKPKSINIEILDFFPKDKIYNVGREKVNQFVLDILNKIPKENKLIFLDIGGYFVNVASQVKKKLGDRFIGVIEDTENGHKKYLNTDLTYPVVSVARSPLKENEDFLVGQAVVFSAEALLREQGVLINSKKVSIIGIGKIGNGILSSLLSKTTQVGIYDIDPVRLVIAHSKGAMINNKIEIIKDSDIIFLATGNLSFKNDEYKYIKNGAFLFSVTSSDDELDLEWLKKEYVVEKISKYIDKYEKNGHYFYLVNNGNAVNFIHGAVVDDFILLVQKEMIDSIIYFSKIKISNKIHSGFDEVKKKIADRWLNKILKINI